MDIARPPSAFGMIKTVLTGANTGIAKRHFVHKVERRKTIMETNVQGLTMFGALPAKSSDATPRQGSSMKPIENSTSPESISYTNPTYRGEPGRSYVGDLPHQGSTPHVCPVCHGRGFVPEHFYDAVGVYRDSQTAIRPVPEMCRACQGKGVLWN